MPFCDQGSSDRKQYLNLSMEAWEIINYDQCRFASTDSKGPKLPLSTFLNQIFQNFYETADASIALQAENHAQKLREILSDGEDRSGLRKKSSPSRGRKPGRTADSMENSNSVGSTNNMNSADSMDNMNCADSTNRMDRTIEKLTAAYVEKLREKSTSYAKGKGEKFRLNQENFSYLTDEDSECQEELFYSSIGQYLKALFEEYASLTHLQREAVYYRSVLETIQQAVVQAFASMGPELGRAIVQAFTESGTIGNIRAIEDYSRVTAQKEFSLGNPSSTAGRWVSQSLDAYDAVRG